MKHKQWGEAKEEHAKFVGRSFFSPSKVLKEESEWQEVENANKK
jgi:hypothetical protein